MVVVVVLYAGRGAVRAGGLHFVSLADVLPIFNFIYENRINYSFNGSNYSSPAYFIILVPLYKRG